MKFPPQLVKQCSDIRIELAKVADTFKVDPQFVGFELLAVEVLLDRNDKNGFQVVTKEEMQQLEDEELFNTDSFKIKQRYDIRIKPVESQPQISLRISPFGDKMRLRFGEGVSLLDEDIFYEEMMREIEAQMAFEGIIIRRRNDIKQRLISEVKTLIQNQTLPPCEIDILESVVYSPHREAYSEFLIPCEDRYRDYKEAYFAVNKGEDIVAFHKAKPSSSGRNLYGEFILATQIDLMHTHSFPKFKNDEVEQIEHGECVFFRSLIDSYVRLKSNEIDFYRQNEFSHINANSTPPLLGGMGKNLTLTIRASNSSQDAIGEGVVLEAANIKIIGNVAKNARIQANEIEIEGSTHQESEIIANRAKIKTHCGNLIADEAMIETLDQGFVQSESIYLDLCQEGEVLSKEANIKKIASNNKVTISYRLHVGNIEGENNIITISSLAYHKTKDLIDVLVKKKNFLINSAKEVYSKYHKILASVKKSKPLIEQIEGAQEVIREQMMQNKDIAEAYGRHHTMIKDLRMFRQELFDYQQFIEKTVNNLVQIDEEVLNAQIYCDKSWGEDTKLIYQREFPKKQVKSLNVDKDFKGGYRIDSETEEFVGM